MGSPSFHAAVAAAEDLHCFVALTFLSKFEADVPVKLPLSVLPSELRVIV